MRMWAQESYLEISNLFWKVKIFESDAPSKTKRFWA